MASNQETLDALLDAIKANAEKSKDGVTSNALTHASAAKELAIAAQALGFSR